MKISAAASAVPRLIVLNQVASTNDELAARVAEDSGSELPEFTTVVSDQQTAGRGRLGRRWVAPPRTMLAISILLRPLHAGIPSAEMASWIPLIAGLAMVRALASLGTNTELKWPNDVLIEGRKVCGILAEVRSPDAVILGSGVNLTMSEDQLPVPAAISMALAGGETDPDLVLVAYVNELRELYGRFAAAGGDAAASGVSTEVAKACSTLDRIVRVRLPGDADLVGVAERLDAAGRLIIRSRDRRTAVSAGDVTHLRY